NRNSRLDLLHLPDDRRRNRIGSRYGEEGSEIPAGDGGKCEMFAVSRRIELRELFGNPLQISLVQWSVGTDGKADSVRRQRDTADQVINRRSDFTSSVEAMIDDNLEDVEMGEVIARELVNPR